MNVKASAYLLLSTLVLIPASRLAGQTGSEVSHAPDAGISEHVHGISAEAIPGAPFTAKEIVKITTHLDGGAVVEQKYFAMIVRDSRGRVYRETRGKVPFNSDREPPLFNTFVSDPKAGTRTTCTGATRTCVVANWHPSLHPVEEQIGPSRDGMSYLTREAMGRSTIDGLDVIDTQETRTYIAGAFGNDRNVVVTKRYWYAPQLQVNLAVNRHDPRTADQDLQLTELSVAEPDPAWFAIPDGFRVVRER